MLRELSTVQNTVVGLDRNRAKKFGVVADEGVLYQW